MDCAGVAEDDDADADFHAKISKASCFKVPATLQRAPGCGLGFVCVVPGARDASVETSLHEERNYYHRFKL